MAVAIEMEDETVTVPFHAKSDGNDLAENSSQLPQKPERPRKSYATVCLLYGYYSIVFTILVPALPALMLEITDDDDSKAAYLLGIANFVRYICEFFASPVMGSLGDYQGRKPMLISSFLVCALEFALLYLIPSTAMVIVTRSMAGIGDCAQAICYTITTDIAVYNGDVVTNSFGLVTAMMGMGFIIGPLLGGLLVEMLSARLCFLVATIISLAGALLTMIVLEESLYYIAKTDAGPDVDQDEVAKSPKSWIQRCRDYWAEVDPITPLIFHFSIPIVRQLSYPYMFSSFVAGIGSIWYIYMDGRYNTSATIVGLYLALYGVCAVSVQAHFIKKIIPAWWNERQAAMYGYLLQGIQYTGYGLMPNVWGLFICVALFSPGLVADPAIKALIVKASLSRSSATATQGNLQGAISGLRTLCTAFGALTFPAVYSYFSNLGDQYLWITFCVAGLCLALAALSLFLTPVDASILTQKQEYMAVETESEEAPSRDFEERLLSQEHVRQVSVEHRVDSLPIH